MAGTQCNVFTCSGIFDDEFIEDRRKGLEEFVNKSVILLSAVCCDLLVCFI